MIVVKGITDFPKLNDRLRGYIDIWWIVQDGGILMLIAYLLQQHKVNFKNIYSFSNKIKEA